MGSTVGTITDVKHPLFGLVELTMAEPELLKADLRFWPEYEIDVVDWDDDSSMTMRLLSQ